MRRLILIISLLIALALVALHLAGAAPRKRRPHTQLVHRVVSYARRQLGTSYRWGGTSTRGFDCSGLVYAAYRSIGRTIPRTTWGQLEIGRRVGWASLRPGDLVFTNGGGHVVLVVSPGVAISAPRTGTRIRFVPLGALRGSFYAARRLLV